MPTTFTHITEPTARFFNDIIRRTFQGNDPSTKNRRSEIYGFFDTPANAPLAASICRLIAQPLVANSDEERAAGALFEDVSQHVKYPEETQMMLDHLARPASCRQMQPLIEIAQAAPAQQLLGFTIDRLQTDISLRDMQETLNVVKGVTNHEVTGPILAHLEKNTSPAEMQALIAETQKASPDNQALLVEAARTLAPPPPPVSAEDMTKLVATINDVYVKGNQYRADHPLEGPMPFRELWAHYVECKAQGPAHWTGKRGLRPEEDEIAPGESVPEGPSSGVAAAKQYEDILSGNIEVKASGGRIYGLPENLQQLDPKKYVEGPAPKGARLLAEKEKGQLTRRLEKQRAKAEKLEQRSIRLSPRSRSSSPQGRGR